MIPSGQGRRARPQLTTLGGCFPSWGTKSGWLRRRPLVGWTSGPRPGVLEGARCRGSSLRPCFPSLPGVIPRSASGLAEPASPGLACWLSAAAASQWRLASVVLVDVPGTETPQPRPACFCPGPADLAPCWHRPRAAGPAGGGLAGGRRGPHRLLPWSPRRKRKAALEWRGFQQRSERWNRRRSASATARDW